MSSLIDLEPVFFVIRKGSSTFLTSISTKTRDQGLSSRFSSFFTMLSKITFPLSSLWVRTGSQELLKTSSTRAKPRMSPTRLYLNTSQTTLTKEKTLLMSTLNSKSLIRTNFCTMPHQRTHMVTTSRALEATTLTTMSYCIKSSRAIQS